MENPPRVKAICYSILLALVGPLTCHDVCQAQVQWACELLDCSQTYSSDNYSSSRILHEPNVWQSRARSSSNCYLFGWQQEEDTESTEEAFVKVKFCNPQQINQIAVVENCNPGTGKQIFLYDTDGKEFLIWTGKPGPVSAPKRIHQITIPTTEYKVAALKFVGIPAAVKGWNGLDGIGIASSPQPISVPIEVDNLGPRVNCKFNDLSARISPDGKTLYTSRAGHPDNLGLQRLKNDQDIWFSEVDASGQFLEARNCGKPWNNSTHNWLISITPDGNTAILAGNYSASRERGNSGIARSKRTKTGWTIPKSVAITNFSNRSDYADYFMSNDQRVLLMAIQGKKSKGNLDLYVSFREKNNHYSEPVNLGKTINTSKIEAAPFLASDGATLYWSTDGRKGLGDQDIWMAVRLDDTWQNWSEPINLGAPINSEDYDSDFSISAQGDYAYLVRYADSYGEGDIFRIALDKSMQPKPVVLIHGKVYNSDTREPLSAEILYEYLPAGSAAGSASSNPVTGEYTIVLPYGNLYGFHAKAPGFYAQTENLDVRNLKEYQEIEVDLFLSPIKVGQTVRLNNIFFESGKQDLLPASFPELQRMAAMLTENSKVVIEIAGHTDDIGSDNDNVTLSEGRAKAVSAYLTAQGVPAERLHAKGYGETQPIASNEAENGREQNRRVEFKVLEQ